MTLAADIPTCLLFVGQQRPRLEPQLDRLHAAIGLAAELEVSGRARLGRRAHPCAFEPRALPSTLRSFLTLAAITSDSSSLATSIS